MPGEFDNTQGIVRESGVSSTFLISTPSIFANTYIFFFFLLLPAQVRPEMTDEQESFIRHILEIPFKQRKWKDLVILDTIHAFYGGLVLTPIARQLQAYTHRRKSSLLVYPSGISIIVSLCFFFRNGCKKAKGTGEESRRCTKVAGAGVKVNS